MTCVVINTWWKISTHTAAIGGVGGALFGFNPVWWFCVVLVVAGILGSARMILRQHSLSQVLTGFAVGFACAAIGIIYL
jgi:membrane-associated phospholipid phosphatase